MCSATSHVQPTSTPSENFPGTAIYEPDTQTSSVVVPLVTPSKENQHERAEETEDPTSTGSNETEDGAVEVTNRTEDHWVRTVEVRHPNVVTTRNLDAMMVNIFGSMQTLVVELRHANTNALTLRREIEGTEEGPTKKKRKRGRMVTEMRELMKGGAFMNVAKRRRV